jgi:hypothetical protein
MGSSSEKGYDSFMPPSVTHALASQKMQNQTCYYSILVKSLYFEDYINQANPHVDVSWLNHHFKSPLLMVESPHYHWQSPHSVSPERRSHHRWSRRTQRCWSPKSPPKGEFYGLLGDRTTANGVKLSQLI